jgi:hypothetical protein
MQTQASLHMPSFEPLFPQAGKLFTEDQPNRPSHPDLREAITAKPEATLSLNKLHERLTLLAHLELPCTIFIADPPLMLRNAIIKGLILSGDSLSISGDDFSLHFRGANIHAIRLAYPKGSENRTPRLEIHHSLGLLYASIQPAPEGVGSAVWRDVMDNPSLSLA